jgi:hypothetical protein
MRTEYFAELEARVRADWAHLSTQVTASGVRCYGHVPQVGDKAWLHRFYPGIASVELDGSEARMGRAIPPQWREALETMAGVKLFVAKVNLYGLLPGGLMRRSVDDPGPFSIEGENSRRRLPRPLVASDDFVIGGCSAGDGSEYVLHPNGSVSSVDEGGQQLLAEWPSVEAMVDAEYAAMSALHDRDGTYRRP